MTPRPDPAAVAPPGWAYKGKQRITPVREEQATQAHVWEHRVGPPNSELIQVYAVPGRREIVYREAHPLGWDPVRTTKAEASTHPARMRAAARLMHDYGSNISRNPHNEFDMFGGGF